MSIRVMSAVWQHSQQTGGALLVLLAIADYADDAGIAWPSIPALARKARLSESQVQRVLHDLTAAGELVVERGGGYRRPSQYRVLMRSQDEGSQNATGRIGAGEGSHPCVREVASMRPKPSREPSDARVRVRGKPSERTATPPVAPLAGGRNSRLRRRTLDDLTLADYRAAYARYLRPAPAEAEVDKAPVPEPVPEAVAP